MTTKTTFALPVAFLAAVPAYAQQTSNYILKYATPPNHINSVIYQDAAGEIGIGTTTPAYKLEVVGNGRFSGYLSVGGHISGEHISLRETIELGSLADSVRAICQHAQRNDHGVL